MSRAGAGHAQAGSKLRWTTRARWMQGELSSRGLGLAHVEAVSESKLEEGTAGMCVWKGSRACGSGEAMRVAVLWVQREGDWRLDIENKGDQG